VARSITEAIVERGVKVAGRVVSGVLSDPRSQEALARAVGAAQQGYRLFASAQERVLHAAGLAARPDYEELRKQVARLKRKARELTQELDRAQAAEPGRGGGSPGQEGH
jgi:hypothetical protein